MDILEIDWKEVNMSFNGNKICQPKLVSIRLRDKFKVRNMMAREPLLFQVMLKQGFSWFTLASNNSLTTENVSLRYLSFQNGMQLETML